MFGALLGFPMLLMPVAFVVSLVGLFKDAHKGYAVAGLLLSGLPVGLAGLVALCV